MTLKEIALIEIHKALLRNGMHRGNTARELGISIRKLRIWLRKTPVAPAPNVDYGPGYLDSVVNREIKRAIELCGGHKAKAAALLGMNYTTLYKRLKVNPDTKRWVAKKWQKPEIICSVCNKAAHARSWYKFKVLKRVRDARGSYLVREGPGGSTWICIKTGSQPSLVLEALGPKSRGGMVDAQLAAEIKKKLRAT